jgi:protein required for attachment to host cells
MAKVGIITADAARARFITAEILDDPDIEGSPRLLEHAALDNPVGESRQREEFSDRPSRKPSGAGPRGASPASDDHRERHEQEEERRFAQRLVEEAQRFVAVHHPSTLVFAAGPRLLGVVRKELGERRWQGLEVHELAEDLCGQPLPKLRDALTRRGILPEPRLPRAGVYRPRGQVPQP